MSHSTFCLPVSQFQTHARVVSWCSKPAMFKTVWQSCLYIFKKNCWAVRPSQKGLPQDLINRRLAMKKWDTQVKVRGDMIILVWKGKWDAHMLTKMHTAPAEGNFCDERRTAIKPATVADYNMHMGWVDKADRMTVIPSVVRPQNGQRNCSSIYWVW